jgi:hypothetical protein
VFIGQIRAGRLRPALARLERSFGQSLQPGQKAVVTERPSNAFRGGQSPEQVGLRLEPVDRRERESDPGSASAR